MRADRIDPIRFIPIGDEYACKLAVTQPPRTPVLEKATKVFAPPPGSYGIDAGCGIGLQAIMLAEAVGQKGRVFGLDHSTEFIRIAERLVEECGMSDRVRFGKGSVDDIQFEDNTFDWAWSSDCIGYAPFDPQPALGELKRVVKPGGKVAFSAWSSEMLLPGYPLLEARLKATSAGVAPFIKDKPAETHFMNLMGRMQAVGFTRIRANTFSSTVYAPLSDRMKNGWQSLIEMRWPGAEMELEENDWVLLKSLISPKSEDYILDDPAYTGFFTYTMFDGEVPE